MSETKPITFFHAAKSAFRADGTLVMHATGWEGDIRWTGQHEVSPEDPDYPLFCHLRVKFQNAGEDDWPFVSSEDLPAVRDEFLRNRP